VGAFDLLGHSIAVLCFRLVAGSRLAGCVPHEVVGEQFVEDVQIAAAVRLFEVAPDELLVFFDR
jgi:hypothetical protein